MKKILISISLLFASLNVAVAQQVQVQDTPPDWNAMMSNLNTSQITSGILLNKVAMFTNLYDYNRGKYNLSHADHFMQSINELYYASDQTKFISAKQLKATLTATQAVASALTTQAIAAPIASPSIFNINIGVINTTLNQLNFNEKVPSTGGLTFVNDKFVPIVGQPSFLSRKIFLAAPLQEMAIGRIVNYKFSNNLIFNNATSSIKKLVVYFNNTTPVTIINNSLLVLSSKSISHTTSGIKTIKFVATFSDDTTITTVGYHYFKYSSQHVIPMGTGSKAGNAKFSSTIQCEAVLVERGVFKSDIAFQGYNEPTAYYGKFDYTVFYHSKNPNGSPNTSDRTMLKPIIVIDGFDPGDTRKTTDCDCEQDTLEEGCFKKNSVDGVFNPATHESIYDLMEYPINNSQPVNLVEKLRSEGYDVIILNIPKYNTTAVGSSSENKAIDGGGDYVERNGLSLASYIQSINNLLIQNGSKQGLVIMGPSMGGLISRYGLAYMEKRELEAVTQKDKDKWKHNTRIWVSFDAPHLGANIPMGAQANIWFFGEKLRNSAAEDKFNNQLNSTAGKQLLISQFKHTLNTLTNGIGNSNNSPFFTQFYSNLNANGVPGSGGFPVSNSSFRKIAIVNGSLNGSKNGVESGEFLNIRGYKDPKVTEGLIGGAVAGSVLPFFGTIAGAIFGGLLGASNTNVTLLRCRDKFYPAYGQTDDIFNGDGQNFKIGWSQWHINHKWYNLKGVNNDIRGSLDIVPAGTFTTGKILKDEIIKGLNETGLSNELRGTNIDTHSFIPAFSALAHLQPYQSWSNPLNTNLTCSSNKLTPFDSYFGALQNTPHISLTKDMVDWLMKEIGDSTNPPEPQAPSFPLDNVSLAGPNIICLDSNTTFSFLDICKMPGAAIWSVTPNAQIVSSTDYSVVLKGLTSDSTTLTATFQNGQTISKTIQVGPPTNRYLYSNPSQCKYIYSPTNDSETTTYIWEYISGTGGAGSYINMEQYGNTLHLEIYATFTIKFKLTKTNQCGTTTSYIEDAGMIPTTPPYCAVSKPALISSTYFKTYPNPSNNLVNIELKNQDQKPVAKAIIIAELYNMMGEVKRNVSITNNIATIDVVGLPKGIYILKININGVIESHQVGVQ